MTTLVALPAWHHGQILAAVATPLLVDLTGLPACQLPGTELTVAARLDAVLDTELDLRDWQAQERYAAA
jgi:hypothetical protein